MGWNATHAITIRPTGNALQFTCAGSDNQPLTLLQSGQLPQWNPFLTTSTRADGIFQWIEFPRTNSLPRFYQMQP